MAGTEPSDGLRVRIYAHSQHLLSLTNVFQVVNALLTQLDKLKHRKNVLVMSTSNLVKAIGKILPLRLRYGNLTYSADSAFVDRADIIQYVDLPSREAIYEILRSSLCEIVNKGLVAPVVRHLLVYVRPHFDCCAECSHPPSSTDV